MPTGITATGGVRLGALARELHMTMAELTNELEGLGVKAGGPNALLDEETANKVRGLLGGAKPGEAGGAAGAQAGGGAGTGGAAPGARPPAPKPAGGGGAVPGMAGMKIAFVGPNPTLKDVAESIGVAPNDAVKKMMALGELVGPHQKLNTKLADKLAAAYGYLLQPKPTPKPEAAAPPPAARADTAAATPEAAPTLTTSAAAPTAPAPPKPKVRVQPGTAQPRPPVVTIMGHVDHGKTTLLDSIRKANVVEGEFGGITQHIGAYQVEVEHAGQKQRITFLDTPGHEAFTAMRARGAQVTDIVILVVAADDGIKPQTVEAISHAQAAEVPIIVAINKMDKPDASADRIKQQLTEHNLVVEDYGGEVIAVPVSAKEGTGIPELLEYVLLVAEVQEFKADPSGSATGSVVEARMEPGRGPVATVLVQGGTLRVGDSVLAGTTHGKVRAMVTEFGNRREPLAKAGPSTPAEITGLDSAPRAGDTFEVVKNDKEARQTAEQRRQQQRIERFAPPTRRLTLADLSRAAQAVPVKDLNVIVKADVAGTVEAVLGQLQKLDDNKIDPEVRLVVKHSGVGNVSESDILLASATEAIVVGFNVRLDAPAAKAAERDAVDVRLYNIIYALVAEMDRAMKGMLTPIYEEMPLGHAEVRARFQTPRGIVICGCFVTDGKVVRGANARVLRNKEVLFDGRIDTLKRIKDDAREVASGYECGLVVRDWTDVKEGDIIECYEMRQIERV